MWPFNLFSLVANVFLPSVIASIERQSRRKEREWDLGIGKPGFEPPT
jgi:hypothetical protein